MSAHLVSHVPPLLKHTFFAHHNSPPKSGSALRLRLLVFSGCCGEPVLVVAGGGCSFGAKADSTSQTESSTLSPP